MPQNEYTEKMEKISIHPERKQDIDPGLNQGKCESLPGQANTMECKAHVVLHTPSCGHRQW